MNPFQVKRPIETREIMVLATWAGPKRTGKMTLHASRWLVGRQRITETACGLGEADLASLDAYPYRHMFVQASALPAWCEDCLDAIKGVAPPIGSI